jgi:phosphotriesterase-related protein
MSTQSRVHRQRRRWRRTSRLSWPGLIGEWRQRGFTPRAEVLELRGLSITGVPLSIHLPGWERLAHDVLDVVEAEAPIFVTPSFATWIQPQRSRISKKPRPAGAFLQYDMIGMDYYYADRTHNRHPTRRMRAIAALKPASATACCFRGCVPQICCPLRPSATAIS